MVLKYCPGVDGSDYINASHVDVSCHAPSLATWHVLLIVGYVFAARVTGVGEPSSLVKVPWKVQFWTSGASSGSIPYPL